MQLQTKNSNQQKEKVATSAHDRMELVELSSADEDSSTVSCKFG